MINMNEETFYEGGPAKSDLIINLIAGITFWVCHLLLQQLSEPCG